MLGSGCKPTPAPTTRSAGPPPKVDGSVAAQAGASQTGPLPSALSDPPPSASAPVVSGVPSPPPSASAPVASAPVPPPPPVPMVTIRAGVFRMGCSPVDPSVCKADERPAHPIYLSPYEIDLYEVSVAHYKACVDSGACSYNAQSAAAPQQNWPVCREQFQTKNFRRPVVCIETSQAQDYCKWQAKRLPTEAEWEKAARGIRDSRMYPWGNASPSAELACMQTDGLCDVGEHPKGVSPFGLHDMAGNAAEWVSDKYHPEYYSFSPRRNPDGFHELLPIAHQVCNTATCQIARGGSWKEPLAGLRSTARSAHGATYHPWWFATIGFRCARSIGGGK